MRSNSFDRRQFSGAITQGDRELRCQTNTWPLDD
jgi:hypothetical protein